MRRLADGIDAAREAEQAGMLRIRRELRELAIEEGLQQRALVTAAVGAGHFVVLRLQMGGVEVMREEDQLRGDEGHSVFLPRSFPDARICDEVEACRDVIEQTAENRKGGRPVTLIM